MCVLSCARPNNSEYLSEEDENTGVDRSMRPVITALLTTTETRKQPGVQRQVDGRGGRGVLRGEHTRQKNDQTLALAAARRTCRVFRYVK